jgi:hypothetical protein
MNIIRQPTLAKLHSSINDKKCFIHAAIPIAEGGSDICGGWAAARLLKGKVKASKVLNLMRTMLFLGAGRFTEVQIYQ